MRRNRASSSHAVLGKPAVMPALRLCKITSGWMQPCPCPLLPLTRNPDDRPTVFRFWLDHTVIPLATKPNKPSSPWPAENAVLKCKNRKPRNRDSTHTHTHTYGQQQNIQCGPHEFSVPRSSTQGMSEHQQPVTPCRATKPGAYQLLYCPPSQYACLRSHLAICCATVWRVAGKI